jgi:hypothetical protein
VLTVVDHAADDTLVGYARYLCDFARRVYK